MFAGAYRRTKASSECCSNNYGIVINHNPYVSYEVTKDQIKQVGVGEDEKQTYGKGS